MRIIVLISALVIPQRPCANRSPENKINEHRKKMDEKNAEIRHLHQEFSDLEDDLRHSGGDAGWSREWTRRRVPLWLSWCLAQTHLRDLLGEVPELKASAL